MRSGDVRLVLDTNTAVSGLIWGGVPGRLIDAAAAGKMQILSSVPLLDRPEQQMGVEKNPAHDRPSKVAITAASRGALKSSGTLTRPLSPPNRLGRGFESIGTSLATLRPALAMITSRPAAASSTILERWVFA